MIVISGALVLMAAILLFIGLLAGSSLTAIYVSIGLSIVAAVFLWLGINQRPVEAPAQAGVRGGGDRRDRAGRDDEGETDRSSQRGQHSRATGDTQASREQSTEPGRPAEVTQQIDVMSDDLVEDSDERTVAAAVATGADVFVVSGHPRYHLEECPAVTGNDEAESLPIGEARELGFVPCGACRPDSEIAENAALPHTSNGSSGLAAPAAAPIAASATAGEPDMVNAPPAVAAHAQSAAPMPPPAVAPPPGTDVPATVPTTPMQPAAEVPAVAPPAAAPAQPAAYQQQPAPPQPAQWQQPAPPQPTQWQEPVPPIADQPPPQQPPVSYGGPVPPPQAAPQLPVAGQPPAAQPAAAAQTAAPEQVVVLPGKARFHRPDCRLVSGPDATEALDKADAVRQGYLACAICKP